MAIAEVAAKKYALELVKTGLQGGSIKLLGPQSQSEAELCGTADAAYLTELLEALTDSLQKL